MITQNIFELGYDPTNLEGITGTNLASLILTAQVATDKGLVCVSTDVVGVPAVPDCVANPSLKHYIWVRISPLTSIASGYVWNPSGLSTILYSDGSAGSVQSNWQPITLGGIGNQAITSAMIANSAVGPTQISSVNASQVTGLSALLTGAVTGTTAASGDITGNFNTGFTIPASTVTGAKIATGTILAGNIAAKTVTIDRLNDSAITSGFLLQSAGVGNGISSVDPRSISKVVQVKNTLYSTQEGTNATPMGADAKGSLTTAQTKSGMGNVSIIPVFATSILELNVSVPMGGNGFAGSGWVGIYDETNAVFLAWTRMSTNVSNVYSVTIPIRYFSGVVGSVATRTFSIYFGCTAAGANAIYLNKYSEGMNFTITEIQP